METAIRWSSNSTLSEQRFLLADVAGRSFKLAKVTEYGGKSLKYDFLSTCTKVPPFRAFDWAPFEENLVAVGQWSGEANILRIDDTAPSISLPTKHQRLCNAVTFSKASLLATGLERVRNVECLNIWDINQRLAAPSPTARPGKTVEPYRKFSSSGAISSIKFSIRQPEVLIAGVKGFGIRIYDLRDNTGNASAQFQTSCVHNVAIDPLNEDYFSCCATGKDTAIQIWDCRSGFPRTAPGYGVSGDPSHQSSPVLEYTEAFTTAPDAIPPNTWSSRFCKGKSGFLGALASNGNFKVFETRVNHPRPENNAAAQMRPASSPIERVFTKRIHEIERPFDDAQKPHEESERIVAFDFTNLAGIKGTPTTILLRGDGSVNIQELSGPPTSFSLSALSTLSVTKPSGRIIPRPSDSPEKDPSFDEVRTYLPRVRELNMTPLEIDDTTNFLKKNSLEEKRDSEVKDGERTLLSSRATHERAINAFKNGPIEDVLASLTRSRRRCAARYNLDPKENMSIVEDNQWLQTMWKWIARAQSNASKRGMVAAGFDLSYLGVFDMWRSDSSSEKHHIRRSPYENDTDLSDAVIARAETLEQIFPEWDVDSKEHRLVCLHTCGLGLSPQQVEAIVRELMSKNEKTKGAAFAVFYDRGKLALEALRSGTITALDRELSLALAAYLNGLMDDGNDTWHQTVQNLATDLSDPYARAILAFVSRGDWHDVLKETSLPLTDRVGIALMYLNDYELTSYINTTTDEAIEAGDIEGIVLTGLGPTAVPLLENYIRKFSDLQTAVLAFAFTSPRYFDDARITAWRETYRHQLDELNLFLQRAHFDTRLNQLALLPDRSSTLAPPARQISICCAYCNNSLDSNPDNDLVTYGMNPPSGGGRRSIFGLGSKDGTSCPKCGRDMPRCAICLKCVGQPDPYTKAARAKETTFEESFANYTSVCLTCWHVFHVGHGEEWFSQHAVCPAPGCNCHCADVDKGFG